MLKQLYRRSTRWGHDGRPPLRGAARGIIAGVVLLALALLGWTLAARPALDGRQLALAPLLAGVLALALRFPLPFGWKTRYQLDTAVIVACALIFAPGLAMLVALAGTLFAQFARRESWAHVAFTSAQLALQAGIAALLLAALGWDPAAPRFNDPAILIGILLAGVLGYLTNTLLAAGLIGAQEQRRPARVWRQSICSLDRAGTLALLGQIGVGLLAALIADAHVWMLALLLLPAAAIYVSLEHHAAVRLRIEETLRAAEASLAEAQRLARLGSWQWDPLTGERIWSDEARRILDIDHDDPRSARDVLLASAHPEDRARILETLARALDGSEPASLDYRVPRADRAPRHVHLQVAVARDVHGRIARILGTLHDITDRKQLEERLTHQAFHDALTGLPNRALFIDRLQQALWRTERLRSTVAVLFLDLDRFKLINDTLGHEAGDQLLIAVAERVNASVRPGDTVARLGGDEFTVLLEDISGCQEAELVAERITRALAAPFTLSGQEMYISTSIGIVLRASEHHTPDDMLRDADVALYHAKDAGRARWAIYDASMGAAMLERVNLEADLRRAIERDELCLHFQPTRRLLSGEIVGAEALIRWVHPRRGEVPPRLFLAIAEESGLIDQLDRWVLEASCREARRWHELRGAPLAVSVNISGRQLRQPELVATLDSILRRSGLSPAALRLEVSEIAAMADAELTSATLGALAELGVSVVIDDFGTGYSSLSHLHRFPIDTLKLDGSVVNGLGRDADAGVIVRAIVGLAQTLGLSVIAEGIERHDQVLTLRAMGCEYGQGNHLAPPLAAEDFAVLLATGALPSEAAQLPAD